MIAVRKVSEAKRKRKSVLYLHFCLALSKLVTKSARLLGNLGSPAARSPPGAALAFGEADRSFPVETPLSVCEGRGTVLEGGEDT